MTDADFLRSLRGREISEADVTEARRIIVGSNSLGKAEELVKRTIDEARGNLKVLKDSDAKMKLLEISTYVATRFE